MDTSGTKWVDANAQDTYEWKDPGQVFEGVYQGSKNQRVGNRHALLFTFKVGNEFVKLWGGAVLDFLDQLEPGCPVRITYKGDAGKGENKYRDFLIQIPEGRSLKGAASDIPF